MSGAAQAIFAARYSQCQKTVFIETNLHESKLLFTFALESNDSENL